MTTRHLLKTEARHTPFLGTPFCWHTDFTIKISSYKKAALRPNMTVTCRACEWNTRIISISARSGGKNKQIITDVCVTVSGHPFPTWNSPRLTSPSHLCPPNPRRLFITPSLQLGLLTVPGACNSLPKVPHHPKGGTEKKTKKEKREREGKVFIARGHIYISHKTEFLPGYIGRETPQ